MDGIFKFFIKKRATPTPLPEVARSKLLIPRITRPVEPELPVP